MCKGSNQQQVSISTSFLALLCIQSAYYFHCNYKYDLNERTVFSERFSATWHISVWKLRFLVLCTGIKEHKRLYTGPVSVDVFALNSSLESPPSVPLFPFPLVTEWFVTCVKKWDSGINTVCRISLFRNTTHVNMWPGNGGWEEPGFCQKNKEIKIKRKGKLQILKPKM